MSLTTIQDINRQVLLYLNDYTLFKLESNEESDTSFWFLRFEKKYGVISKDINLKEQYIKWVDKDIKYIINDIVINGYLELLKAFVENGIELNDDIFYFAIINGSLDIIKYFVSLGADIHYNNDYAVRLASEKGQLEVIKYLIKTGANIHANNNEATRLALSNGYLDNITRIIISV